MEIAPGALVTDSFPCSTLQGSLTYRICILRQKSKVWSGPRQVAVHESCQDCADGNAIVAHFGDQPQTKHNVVRTKPRVTNQRGRPRKNIIPPAPLTAAEATEEQMGKTKQGYGRKKCPKCGEEQKSNAAPKCHKCGEVFARKNGKAPRIKAAPREKAPAAAPAPAPAAPVQFAPHAKKVTGVLAQLMDASNMLDIQIKEAYCGCTPEIPILLEVKQKVSYAVKELMA